MNAINEKLEEAMVRVAETVAEEHVKSGMVLGLGSGAAATKFARALGQRLRSKELKDVLVVPSSMQAWMMAKENSLPLYPDSAHFPRAVDATVDGADQISLATRSMIKGGGGALLREKVILSSSKHSYILVDSSKIIQGGLTRSVPVEVVQFALEPLQERMEKEFRAQPVLRRLDKGFPYFTESGNVILDCQFGQPIRGPVDFERSLKALPGVVEVGVFNCKVDRFYVGNQDGSVESH